MRPVKTIENLVAVGYTCRYVGASTGSHSLCLLPSYSLSLTRCNDKSRVHPRPLSLKSQVLCFKLTWKLSNSAPHGKDVRLGRGKKWCKSTAVRSHRAKENICRACGTLVATDHFVLAASQLIDGRCNCFRYYFCKARRLPDEMLKMSLSAQSSLIAWLSASFN